MPAAGAIFNLVVRDERYDQYFVASDYLRKRLNEVRLARKAAGEKNIQPNFADIERTHVNFIRSSYKPYVAVASEYTAVKPSGDGGGSVGLAGGSVQFTFPTVGHFTSDMVLNVRTAAVGTSAPTGGSNFFRYCAYPGVRLLRKVEERSDEFPLDDYTADDVVLWADSFLHDDYQAGFDRCMGQQELKTAEFFNSNGYTGVLPYRNGAQTPKFRQPELEMWIPLQFWHCRSPDQALLNDLIPNTQRTINIDLAPLGDILQEVTQAGVITTLSVNKLPLTMTLYVNNLYVNPEVHDVFASRIGMHLVRTHRRQVSTLSTPSGRVLLSQLKSPTEYLMAGVRDKANAGSFDQWNLFGRAPVHTNPNALSVATAEWNAGVSLFQVVVRLASESSTLDTIVDRIGVTANGITIYDNVNTLFYNSYLPMRYLSQALTVPSNDRSVWFIPFCLHPGITNPSGYFNLSTMREMYFNYSGTQISATQQAELVVSASALNFLVRKGDKCSLLYAL